MYSPGHNSRAPVRAAPPAEHDKLPLPVLGIFAAYIIVWFLQLGDRIAFANAIRLEFLLGVTLIGLSFFVPRQKPEVTCNLYGYVAVFFVALLVEIPFSYDVDYSWTVFVDRVVKFAFMAVFIIVYVRSPRALRFFLFALLLAWFKMGQEGFVGQITGSLVWENQGVMRLHGVTGNYQHPNSFSGFGLGMLPFIYYFFPLVNKWIKGVLLVMVVFAVNIVLFTGSRTGYVGFVLFALYVFWKSQYKLKFTIAGLIIALVAIPFVPQQYRERFASITGEEKEGHSKLRRLEILQDAIVIFEEHPFGVGVSAFPKVRMQRFGRIQDTHNLYLEVATNLGIQGFIVWALLIVALFRNVRRLSKDLAGQIERVATRIRAGPEPQDPQSPLARHLMDLRYMNAALNAASAYVVVRLVVGFFGMDLYEIYWWFAIGIVIAIHNLTQVAARITQSHLAEGAQSAASSLPLVANAPVQPGLIRSPQS